MFLGREWRPEFNIHDCQGRQRSRQADMTCKRPSEGLLLFAAFLCMSLRESLLIEEVFFFPVAKHIFPFAALNASEGLRHKTKWGVDDRLGATRRALRFIQSEKQELRFASSLRSDLTFCFANAWVNGGTGKTACALRDRRDSAAGLLSSLQALTYALICLFLAFQVKHLRSNAATWPTVEQAPPRSHRSGVLQPFSVSLFVSCRDEESWFVSLGT